MYCCDGLDIAAFDEKKQQKKSLQEEEQKESTKKKKQYKSQATKDQYAPSQIHHIAYSSKHDCFIIVTEDKRIRILLHRDKIKSVTTAEDESTSISCKPSNDGMYSLFGFKNVLKKISSICLSPMHNNEDEQYLVAADKFGVITVLRLPSLKTENDGSAHLSIITHIAFDPSGKYLISSDKDFKLRISRFPQLSIIDGFCFGHTQAVTKCAVVDVHQVNESENESKDIEMKGAADSVEPQNRAPSTVVISGSVDGTVRIWSVPFGKQLAVFQFRAKNNVQGHDDGIFGIDCNLDDLTTSNPSTDSNHSKTSKISCHQRHAQRASMGKEYVTSVQGQSLIVSDIGYSEKDRILAVTFNRSTMIYLFALDMTNALKPKLEALYELNVMEKVEEFNGFNGMQFDDNGNLVVLICGKTKEKNRHLILKVFAISKMENGTVSVQNAKDDVVIGMVQKQIYESSVKVRLQVTTIWFALISWTVESIYNDCS